MIDLDKTINDVATQAAKVVVDNINIKLNSGRYPDGDSERGYVSIQESIVVGSPQQTSSGVEIEIQIGGSQAPYAPAFEYGSGLHRTTGVPKEYIIEPKRKPALAFPFTISYMPRPSKLVGVLGIGSYEDVLEEFMWNENGQLSGIMFWNYIEHPGIKPYPFIKPTLPLSMKSIVELFKAKVTAKTVFKNLSATIEAE